MFERFTDRARRVVVLAQEEARKLDHNYIGTEHLLLGVIAEGEGVAPKVLESLGIELDTIRQTVKEIIGRGDTAPSGHIPFTPRAKKALELSLRESLEFGHNHIGTEHLLLALIREGEGVAAQVLVKLGANLTRTRERVRQLADVVESAEVAPSSPMLDQFGRNLTLSAREGKFDPVVGRAKEIERVMQVLSRRTKNNPVLIGETGVGKSAIVEGLAQMLVKGEVPVPLKHKMIYTLDFGPALEENIKAVLREMRTRGDIILFIEELNTLTTSVTSEGGRDMRTALARGECQVICAANPADYTRSLEADSIFAQRCQPVRVPEPAMEEAVEILRGVRDRFEAHHRVSITDDALAMAVRLTDRYVKDSRLPGKAIDLIDEAGSRMWIRRMTAPPDVRELDEQIADLRHEKEAAIDQQDWETAAKLRDREKDLLSQKAKRENLWKSQDLDIVTEVDGDLVADVLAQLLEERDEVGSAEPRTGADLLAELATSTKLSSMFADSGRDMWSIC